MLFFNIVGTDLSRYARQFEPFVRDADLRRPLSLQHMYLDFYAQLKAEKVRSPALPMVLRHFLISCSDLFPRQGAAFLAVFRDMQRELLPRLRAYLVEDLPRELPVFADAAWREEILAEQCILERELEEVLRAGGVGDKLAKYDSSAA